MYTKHEEYYLGIVSLLQTLQGGIKGQLNVILTPAQSRFLLAILLREKNRITGPGGGPDLSRLVEKAISTAERAIENFGKDFEE
jgi:hypothetical protein